MPRLSLVAIDLSFVIRHERSSALRASMRLDWLSGRRDGRVVHGRAATLPLIAFAVAL
jgi:hypothetical protein